MKRHGLILFILLVISLVVVWPAFSGRVPTWMGAVDGLVLSKARFMREGLGLGTWNGYWFLGIPGQHIGSPVLPLILSLVSLGVAPDDPSVVFVLWRSLVALAVVGTIIAVYFLVVALLGLRLRESGNKKARSLGASQVSREAQFVAAFVSLFIILMPSVVVIFPQIWGIVRSYGWPSWLLFSAFYLGEGQQVIGFVLVLGLLGLSWRLIDVWSIRGAVALALLVAFLLVVDSLSFLTMMIWLAVLLLTRMVRPSLNQKSLVIVSLRLLLVCIFGFLLTCFWFTPSFILSVVGAPSLGGEPFAVVVVGLLRKFLIVLPAVLGVVVARRWFRNSSWLVIVGSMGLLLFGGLTVASFVADTDFWQDYSRFARSLDLSLGLVIGGLLYKGNWGVAKRFLVLSLIVVLSLPFALARGRLFLGTGQFSQTAEYRVGKALNQLVASDCGALEGCRPRVYLSGSSVFWLNAWFNVAQVRGGGEQGSVNSWWQHGSYQIREGINPELSELWLRVLGVSYLVVHNKESSEVYHDFVYPLKFKAIEGWDRVWEDRGDLIYRRQKGGLAEIVDLGILTVTPPKKGDDLVTLRRYVGYLKNPVSLIWVGNREVLITGTVNGGEGVRLAISYSPFWRVVESSIPVKVRRDSLGMLVLQPKQTGALTVRLRFDPWTDLVVGFVLSACAFVVLLKRPSVVINSTRIFESLIGRESELDRTAL